MNNKLHKDFISQAVRCVIRKSKNEAGFFFEIELTIGDKEIYICDRILSEFDKKNMFT